MGVKVSGSIHQLNSRDQALKSNRPVVVIVGQHVGFINSGKGLKLGIFKEAGRTNRQGIADVLEIHFKITYQRFGKMGRPKQPGDFLVAEIRSCKLFEVVFTDKGIKPVGGQDQRFGDLDVNIFKLFLPIRVFFELGGDKGQPSGLAPQGSFADFYKISIRIK